MPFMSDAKLFGLCTLMAGLLIAIALGVANIHVLFPLRRTAVLMPGQSWYLHNSDFSDISITSDYPVSVREGYCYFPRVASIRLRCPASDIQITDSRPRLLIWAQSNRVNLTAR